MKPLLILLFACPFFVQAQSPTYASVKNGVFIYFSRANGSKATCTRSGETQKEINPVTRESALWDVQWLNDSVYSMQYNSGLEDKPREELKLLQKHKVIVQILAVTEDYYTYRTSLDKVSNPAVSNDTLWIKQHRDAKNKMIGNPRIDSLLAIRRAAYDTMISRSATLYVFRPGKFTQSAVNCMISINGTPACEMTNKAAYILRLTKEGEMTITAQIDKQKTNVTIEVTPGAKFYLRCEIPWTLGPKPRLTLVNEVEGKTYFDNIKQ